MILGYQNKLLSPDVSWYTRPMQQRRATKPCINEVGSLRINRVMLTNAIHQSLSRTRAVREDGGTLWKKKEQDMRSFKSLR